MLFSFLFSFRLMRRLILNSYWARKIIELFFYSVAKVLLAANADVEIANFEGNTPLLRYSIVYPSIKAVLQISILDSVPF